MKKIVLSLLILGIVHAGYSQVMSNTDNVLTLNGSCLNPTLASGTYTLELLYVDPDNGPVDSVYSGTIVSSDGSVATMTVPRSTLPNPDNNGWWSLPASDNGTIILTGGPTPSYVVWYHDDQGILRINCVPLPVVIDNFSIFPIVAGKVQLSWRTEEEQNSTVIEIWRSPTRAANSFYRIGSVPAAGNSNIPLNYSFSDSIPDTTNYYYVRMLNSQGTPPAYSDTILYACSTCTYTPPAPTGCSDSIIGPDHICDLGVYTPYHLSSSLPDYNTIVWTVDQPGSVKVNTNSDDPTQVTLLRTNVPALVTLTATVSGCTNPITKTLVVGAPAPALDSIFYICPSAMTVYFHNNPSTTNFGWRLTRESSGFTAIVPNGLYHRLISLQRTLWTISVAYTDACGNSDSTLLTHLGCPSSPAVMSIQLSPNPATGMVRVATGAADHKIHQVRIVDGEGIIRKTFRYAGDSDNVSVDVSSLPGGIYTVQVFDNRTWQSGQLVLTK